MPEKPELPGPRRLGRYALHAELAAGGMAVVHFGRLLGPVGFSRTVAIKRLHPHLARDASFRAMFLDEARLAARVRHPNVVPILDVVDDGDDLYLVMEYVHGESFDRLLKTSLKSGTSVPLEITVAVLRDVLHGLHAAHDATSERGRPLGIVHRDVSPHNVLCGVDGVARVHDFGVAKAQARIQLTTEGQLKGKIAYMAPEQVDQSGLDRRADVWSSCVVLWEALTKKRLFVGDHPAQLMKRVLAMRIPHPSEIDASIPPVLDQIVMRGLERDRDARFSSAHELAVALESTGLAAAQHEVGEWVARIAARSLSQRARVISEIEGAATSTDTALPVRSNDAPQEGTQTAALAATSITNAETRALTRRSTAERSRVIPFVGVAALAAAAGAAVAVLALRDPAEPAALSSSLPPPLPAASAAAADASAPLAPPPAIASSAPKPRAAKRVRPAAISPPPTRRADDCNPPYIVDEDNVRVPKLHCLK